MRPNLLTTRTYLARGAWLWITTRVLVSTVFVLAGADPLRLTFAATMSIIGGTFALGMIDMHRRHEQVLLGNLAVSRTAIAFFFVGPAILGELTIVVAASFR